MWLKKVRKQYTFWETHTRCVSSFQPENTHLKEDGTMWDSLCPTDRPEGRLYWIDMFYHVLPCSTMFYHGLPCSTMFYHGLPCSTMFYHGLPCSTMDYHVLPCTTMCELQETLAHIAPVRHTNPSGLYWFSIQWDDKMDAHILVKTRGKGVIDKSKIKFRKRPLDVKLSFRLCNGFGQLKREHHNMCLWSGFQHIFC